MKKLVFAITGALFFSLVVPAFAEDVKVTTNYPSPYGVYKELSSTGKTTLATGATATDQVVIGASVPVSTAKLDITGNLNTNAGNVQTSSVVYAPSATAPGSPAIGTLYYDSVTGSLKVWNGTEWLLLNTSPLTDTILATAILGVDFYNSNSPQGGLVVTDNWALSDTVVGSTTALAGNYGVTVDLSHYGGGSYRVEWWKGVLSLDGKDNKTVYAQLQYRRRARAGGTWSGWTTLDATDPREEPDCASTPTHNNTFHGATTLACGGGATPDVPPVLITGTNDLGVEDTDIPRVSSLVLPRTNALQFRMRVVKSAGSCTAVGCPGLDVRVLQGVCYKVYRES